MSWTNKVTWSEGLFLRPQLFQQQDRYLEAYAHKRAAPLSPFYWGFSQYTIDSESLSLGKLVLSSCAGLFADGTPFESPAQTAPPPPLALLPEHQGELIYLALPIRTPNGEETNFDDTPGSPARFVAVSADVIDANAGGAGSKEIQLGQLRLRLLPQKELTAGWMGLPLGRLTALRSDGAAQLDDTHIPPINCIGASHTVMQWLGQLHGNAVQRRDTLAARLSGSAGSTQAGEVSDYLILQILNRYEPLLGHLIAVPETNPEHAYTLLRTLAGELSTFVRNATRKAKDHPPYTHLTPLTSFKALVDDARELLNNVLARSAQNIHLATGAYGQYSASLDPNEIKSYAGLILAVTAQMGPERIASQFITHAKAAPNDRLADLVRSHLPGITLSALPVAPRQIPFNAGYVYFQLEPRGVLWEHLLTHGGLGLHLAIELPGLHIELWGVK